MLNRWLLHAMASLAAIAFVLSAVLLLTAAQAARADGPGGWPNPPLRLKWSNQIGWVRAAPVVANGLVYAVAYPDGVVFALDIATGDVKWASRVGGLLLSSPAVANGVLYVGNNGGGLYSLDASTGELKWSYPTGGAITGALSVSNGTVYVASDKVYALDASTGALRWAYAAGGTDTAVAEGAVYVSSRNQLYAIDANTGTLMWNYTADGSGWFSAAAVAKGVVYATYTGNDSLYALNAADGTVRCSFYSGIMPHSAPAVAGGTVYFGSWRPLRTIYSIFYALDATTCSLLWSYDASFPWPAINVGYSDYTAAVANSVVYVVNGDGQVLALDAKAGARIWSYALFTGSGASSPPVAAGGMLFGGSGKGVHAFESAQVKVYLPLVTRAASGW